MTTMQTVLQLQQVRRGTRGEIVMEGRVVLDKTTGRIPAFLPLIVWAAYQLVLSKFNQNNYESANNNKKRKGERRKTEEQKNTNGRGIIYIHSVVEWKTSFLWAFPLESFCQYLPLEQCRRTRNRANSLRYLPLLPIFVQLSPTFLLLLQLLQLLLLSSPVLPCCCCCLCSLTAVVLLRRVSLVSPQHTQQQIL